MEKGSKRGGEGEWREGEEKGGEGRRGEDRRGEVREESRKDVGGERGMELTLIILILTYRIQRKRIGLTKSLMY